MASIFFLEKLSEVEPGDMLEIPVYLLCDRFCKATVIEKGKNLTLFIFTDVHNFGCLLKTREELESFFKNIFPVYVRDLLVGVQNPNVDIIEKMKRNEISIKASKKYYLEDEKYMDEQGVVNDIGKECACNVYNRPCFWIRNPKIEI